MPDFITSNLVNAARQFAHDYWTHAVAIILAIFILGMLLGSAKRLTWRLFTSALRAGEHIVNEILARPKGMILSLGIAGIAAPSFILGWRSAPERVVEKPVRVEVPDRSALAVKDREISELKSLLESTKGDQSGVVSKAMELEGKLATAEGENRTLGGRIEALANEKAEVEARLASLLPKPEPDKDRAKTLIASINWAHMKEVRAYFDNEDAEISVQGPDGETVRLKKTANRVTRSHRWKPDKKNTEYICEYSYDICKRYCKPPHSELLGYTPYHKRCQACETNMAANEELDAIFARNRWNYAEFHFTGDEHAKQPK